MINFEIYLWLKNNEKEFWLKQNYKILTSRMGVYLMFLSAFWSIKRSQNNLYGFVVLTFCCLVPTLTGNVLLNKYICNALSKQIWFLIFQDEIYGINSIVNAFIYGMRHIKQRKAYGYVLSKTLRCQKFTDWSLTNFSAGTQLVEIDWLTACICLVH